MRVSGKLYRIVLAAAMVGGNALAAMAQTEDGQAAAFRGKTVRGVITATATDHLTLKTETGEIYQVALTPNTRLMKGRDPVKLADIHAGDGIGAMGEIDAEHKTVHALYVGVVDAEQLKKAREAMGKTYIAGKVTAIEELKLTILRSDNVTQTIAVDDDTSFKKGGRGLQQGLGAAGFGGMGGGGGGAGAGRPATPESSGESITLADIKVGDTVVGPGALKSGVFIPTQLNVIDPAAAGQGRRRRQGADASQPPAATEPK